MASIGSSIASSSGGSSSRGPLVPMWISLPLEEHLKNFENFEREIAKLRYTQNFVDNPFLESIAKVVNELRRDPLADIESFLSLVLDPMGLLSGTTPLHWAVLMDDRKMVNYILSSGKVDINASTTSGKETALAYAIMGGNSEIVEDLLEHKADVGISNIRNISAFGYMVYQKDSMLGILKKILVDNVNKCDNKKRTALHYAAREETIDIVAYLLNEKADVNLQDHFGYTPLHYAVENKSLDVITHLLRQNANVNTVDENGTSPLHVAALHEATNFVSLLLNHEANVNALNKNGHSPFILSSLNARFETSKLLIASGARIDIQDQDHNNALHLAIQAHGRESNMKDIVKFLQECDVDANAKNKQGYSPFFAAVVEDQIEVVEEFLQSKEKIKLMEECNGQTVIQVAFDDGHEYIKRLLLKHDDVNQYVKSLYRDRQVYVDAANAILIGAALIASVTFASWLQPPLDYTTSYLDLVPSGLDINYVDVQHNVSLRAFWVFNILSFYFAIGTVVFGARSVLPRQKIFIKEIVDKLHRNLLITSILLACSVFCVLAAFGIAGTIVLTPTLKFQWYIIVPTVFGGLVCLVSLGFLFKSMLEDNIEKKRREFRLYN